jgi:hypothetical protein
LCQCPIERCPIRSKLEQGLKDILINENLFTFVT